MVSEEELEPSIYCPVLIFAARMSTSLGTVLIFFNQSRTMPLKILVGASVILEHEGYKIDLDSILPDDISQLTEDPARRAVQLAFFVTWVMWQT